MFDVGIWEVLLVLVVALLVIGPKQLPVVAEKIGRFVRQIKNMLTKFNNELK